MSEVTIPTDPGQIAELLTQSLDALLQLLDAIPVGFEREPSPAFRVIRSARP